MSDDVHLLLGAYLLGGLSPAERGDFERHLPGCERCRAELVEMAPVPALLRRATAATTATAPPAAATTLPTLLDELAGRRRRRHRRTRWLAGAAAAVVIGTGGATTAVVLSRDPGNPDPVHTVPVAAAAGSSVTGSVELVGKPWGTALTLTVAGLDDQGPFTLAVADATGSRQQAATWSATPDGRVTVVGATGFTVDHLTSVSVVAVDGRTVAAARP